jgi:ABC-type multidrug transport system fused ATPase/permease subunit
VKTVEKWADRVYAENDFGRSIATSISGLIGLAVYLLSKDWVIAAFASIITFPVVRIIATGINEKVERNKKRKVEKEEAENLYNKLSADEKKVIQSFVMAGGSVLTWNQMNNQDVSSNGVESLIQREILWTSMTADGMRETFALDSNVFDICNEKMVLTKNS